MYQLSPISVRVARIRKRCRDTKPKICIERFKIVTDYYVNNPAKPGILKRAEVFKELCEKMPTPIFEDEVIVGSLTKMYRGSALYPEYSSAFLFDELKDGSFYERDLDPYDLDPEDAEYIMKYEDFWRKNCLSSIFDYNRPDGFMKVLDGGVLTYGPIHNCTTPVGHFCANFENAINKGFKAIRDEAIEKKEALEGRIMGDHARKYYFYKAISIVCEGIITLSKRYAEECRRQAENADENRKKELVKMAEVLDWIIENPCRNFHEALQCVYLYQLALALDGNLHGLTFGRVDQYLGKFYEKDLEEGKITPEEAQELIDLFMLKVAEMNKVASKRVTKSVGGYTSGQLITIGGVDKDGKDATNPVTYMILQSSNRLALHDPPVSLRVHENTPQELWEAAIECTKKHGGVPTFENDEVIIPALIGRGLSIEDARDYCLIGCVEPAGVGTEWPACGGPGSPSFWNMANCVLQAINNGYNPMPKPDGTERQQSGLPTGYLYEMESFEEVMEAVKKQMKYYIDWNATLTNVFEYFAGEFMPLPIVSATMDGCMEKGMDVMWGGAKYNSTGFAGIGIANIIDSLAVIKYMVYDKKLISAKEFYDAVMANWEGYEPLRQRILNDIPRYGNDNEYTNSIATEIINYFSDEVNSCTGPRGRFSAGLYPVATHVVFGKMTWATPDGRKAGEPLADGISPKQGVDKNGPTAILKSAVSFDHVRTSNGTLLNMKIHPKSLEGQDGNEKLKNLIQTYFKLGGMELQFNIISTKQLRDAQNNPSEYRDLVVRIAGFSAYFVELDKDLQDDVIRRTELQL